MRRNRFFVTALTTALAAMILVNAAMAAPIMPSFGTLPAGWTTDRYEPASFANVGTFQGHSNTLGIGIDSTTGLSARPAPYQTTFYNTQGRGYTLSPAGPGSVLSADLYIPASWANAANGNVRTDMWGVMVDSGSSISAYPIIGFTNYGGVPRLRVWEGTVWVDLATPIVYNTWHRLSIELLADSTINFYANGAAVYSDTATDSSAAFSSVLMQAYNFDDPSIVGTVLAPYTAHWSNAFAVPTNANQCKNGGWANLYRTNGTSFRNQGDCIQYVNTGK